jgi:hypothetical protein
MCASQILTLIIRFWFFLNYRMRAIITRSLYTFYPIFEDQKRFLRSFFRKILTLCMVSIQERVIVARVPYLITTVFDGSPI